MSEQAVTEDYEVYVPDRDDAEPFPIEEDTATNVNLIEEMGFEIMHPRLWYFEPGDKLTFHYHTEMEEIFYVVRGTGQMVIGSDRELIEIPEGGFVRPGIKTPRQVKNETDEEVIWLMIGAPDVTEGMLWTEYDENGRPADGGEYLELAEWF